MKKVLALMLFSLIIGCKSNNKPVNINFVGDWVTQEGPYVIFKSNNEPARVTNINEAGRFEFGVNNDPKPLIGKYTISGDIAELTAQSIILDDEATTMLKFQNQTDSLKLVYIEIQAKQFSILVDVKNNYAKTIRGDEIKEMKLTDPEAPSQLFIYYELTKLTFKKN
jgi:hypothetical protein